MKRLISVLRGINVGGRRKILMADLKDLYQKLGFNNITTYIQSGNVIFDYTGNEEINTLEDKIQAAIFRTFGFEVPVIIRSVDELKEIISNNPFETSDKKDGLYLTFLKEAPNTDNLKEIKNHNFDSDEYKIIDKNIFIYTSGKYSDSKLSNNLFEKKLKVVATTRNWKTINKLFEIAAKD